MARPRKNTPPPEPEWVPTDADLPSESATRMTKVPASWRQTVLALAAGTYADTSRVHPVIRCAVLQAAANLIRSTITPEELAEMRAELAKGKESDDG